MRAQPEELGLRERKRRATRRSIQLAVLRLTAHDGLDQVTVDDISRDAGVSPRTFFNYFPSKEASLAGDMPFALGDGVAEAYEDAGPEGDALGDLLEIMAAQAHADGAVDPELHTLRRAVMRDYPQIFALRIDRMREFESVVAASAARRLTRDAHKRGVLADETEIGEQARLIGLLSLTIARAAWVAWSEHPETESLPDLMRRSHRRLQEVVAQPSRV
ncbi:MAG: TetR family transcriptional regulator [Herbiconiux sp.]|nr:TetR family transcriptional regulator [Herbiconiux sp.]